MEWLEFGRWSPEVEQGLALQAARLSIMAKPVPSPSPRPQGAQARQLEALLKETPASNPWGHPVAEC
ncbi:MAG TPA: hypothetical protein VK458_15485 [Myxococcaceae bacterium]|nr:hypothetical protein [Myxococcaceae bacterium]